jgi:hypothetical protein
VVKEKLEEQVTYLEEVLKVRGGALTLSSPNTRHPPGAEPPCLPAHHHTCSPTRIIWRRGGRRLASADG